MIVCKLHCDGRQGKCREVINTTYERVKEEVHYRNWIVAKEIDEELYRKTGEVKEYLKCYCPLCMEGKEPNE